MIVVGFRVDVHEINDSLTSKELYERALSDDTAIIYDNLQSFQCELNNDLVDTENNYFFFLKEEGEIIKGLKH